MGCGALQSTGLRQDSRVIHTLGCGSIMKCIFFQETISVSTNDDRCAMFSSQISSNAIIFGSIFCNRIGFAKSFASRLEYLLKENLFLRNEQYVEGFQNFLELLSQLILSPLELILHSIDENPLRLDQEVVNIGPSNRILMSVNCIMKVERKLYLFNPLLTGIDYPINLLQSKYYFKLKNQNSFFDVEERIDDLIVVSDFITQLKCEFADYVISLVISDEMSSKDVVFSDPRINYPKVGRYWPSRHMHQLKVFFSEEEILEYEDDDENDNVQNENNCGWTSNDQRDSCDEVGRNEENYTEENERIN